MRNKTFIILASFAILLCSCERLNTKKCCTQLGYYTEIDSNFIAVPNIFTPNNDGLNDYFYVFVSDNISSINLKIKDGSRIIYEVLKNNISSQNIFLDGKVNGNISKEKMYHFEANAVTSDGRNLTLSGEFCLLINKCVTTLNDCTFATQYNGLGGFDLSRNNLENISLCR